MKESEAREPADTSRVTLTDETRTLVRKAVEEGWLAALNCHSDSGMPGWSVYGVKYREQAIREVLALVEAGSKS